MIVLFSEEEVCRVMRRYTQQKLGPRIRVVEEGEIAVDSVEDGAGVHYRTKIEEKPQPLRRNRRRWRRRKLPTTETL